MSINWVRSNAFSGVPPHAVVAGHDIDGSTIYVGRAYHEGDWIPAKVIPEKRIAYVPHGGREIGKHDFDVLCGHGLEWVNSSNGHVPPEAVYAGNQSNGESLYVGRAHVSGSLTTGKIHPSHGCIYVPFDGSEHRFTQYDVLVVARKRSTWVPSSRHSSTPEGAIFAGHDQDGSPMYIGRAQHAGDTLPAKVLPTKQACYVAYGGQEVLKDHFDVLCYGSVSWVRANPNSHIPHNAVQGGTTSSGEPLYIGRAEYNGSVTVGKVQKSHGALYLPFAGQEVAVHSDIEVLVEH